MPQKRLSAPTKKPVRVAPVRPNIGLTIAYQARLDRLIDMMQRDVERQIKAQWRRNTPMLAEDESAPAGLRGTMGRLAREWSQRFNNFAQKWGRKFAEDATGAADRSFAGALRRAGFTVKFTMTPAANEVMQATIAEQVSLIRSIPQAYMTDVQGAVMRSVQVGRDLGTLSQYLQATYGVTRRRAATIARDQNNKTTASITRVRQQELGITHATWLHSAGGKTPRPEHVAFRGKTYEIAKGAFLEGEWVWPGTAINCRCVSKAIIPGLQHD